MLPEGEKGLTSAEARALFDKHGPNKLPEKPPPSSILILISQFKSPLVYILLAAGIVTALLGEIPDTIIITAAVLINTILGFVQEKKASRALSALKQLVHPEAEAVRDGEPKKIPIEEVVPGDLLVLSQGYKVPADGKVVASSRLAVNEAILTGESATINKNEKDVVFMGTAVAAGRAYMKAEVTGAETQIGKIAQSVQEIDEDTPLRRQLVAFSKLLSILVLVLIFFVFLIGLVKRQALLEIFTTSVALAVSAIPEGLLVGLTVVLAIGMQRILSKKGLVRNLVSAETLGGVTTITTDKTGTLTEGKMRVIDVLGDKVLLAKQSILANDRDDPVVIAAWEWANKNLSSKDLKSERIDGYIEKHGRLDEIPFSGKERFASYLIKLTSKTNVIYVNGAPEFVLEWTNLSNEEKKNILEQIDEMTKKGHRLMAMARKKVAGSTTRLTKKDIQKDLEWVGIIVLSDPVRNGVKAALEKTQKAGIKLLVITGDYAQTAISVMHELGLSVSPEEVVLGEELEKTTEAELSEKLYRGNIRLFARTRPEQKLKIVDALKKNGEVVAMIGDGVNDAPALSKADIGIVVGEATDVARESADLVLLDSSFNTVVMAIEEGRGIFDNIRKIVLYLMSDAFSEIVAVIGTLILAFPLPVTAAQILWINLASDGFPHLALTVDPKRPGTMSNPPRSPVEQLVTGSMRLLIALISLVGGALAIIVFIWVLTVSDDITLARSVAFATLGINSLVYVFSIRTLSEPFWKSSPLANPWLLVAVAAGFFIQVAPFVIRPLGEFLRVSPLPLGLWAIPFGASAVMFLMVELTKPLIKKHA